MAREIVVKVILSAEEYLGLKAVCDEYGMTQSARLRWLCKQDIGKYVHTLEIGQEELFDKADGHVLAKSKKGSRK